MTKHLFLGAQEASDLEVISAQLQDAILRVGNIVYLEKRRQMAFVMSRFMWEEVDPDRERPRRGRKFHRIQTGLHFNDVLKIHLQNFSQEDPEAFLSLLNVNWVAGEDGTGTVDLEFSGTASIRLEVECLDATMRDISEPWQTKNLPSHEEED